MSMKAKSMKWFQCFLIVLLFQAAGMDMQAVAEGYPSEEETYIVIDKTRRLLTVYVNDTPEFSFLVATGKGDLTPEGEFRVANKIKNPWYMRKRIPGGDKKNPLGTRWLGLSVPNTGGYRYGIHGTNKPYSIGQHVSSGCIRMRNRDVEWLFRHIPEGTKVFIQK